MEPIDQQPPIGKTPNPVPPSPVVPQDEQPEPDLFSDDAEDGQSASNTADNIPTVGEQAGFILQDVEAEKLSDRDKAYLQQVERDMGAVVGILHRNADGTYAPLNDPNGADRIVDSSSGERKVTFGYRFRNDTDVYAFTTDPDRKYTNDNLTDSVAKEIMKRDPRWSRANMVRGAYEEGDKYWNKG